jgi:membrane-associated phospholipid phosphatase
VAKYFSIIFHPFLLATCTQILVIFYDQGSWGTAVLWSFIGFLCSIVPTLIFILLLFRRQQITDWDISVREQRGGVYLLAVLFLALLTAVFLLFDGPMGGLVATLTAGVSISLAALLNKFASKVSLHTIGAAGSALVLLPHSWVVGMLFLGMAAAVSWSRLQLRRHTAVQVFLGWIVSLISVSLIYYRWLF